MDCCILENMRQKLYAAMDDGDNDIAYKISRQIDELIIEYYKSENVRK
ncbi:MAG TPA: hypothetical protein DD429_02225 [Clostridiaceae bacterium]|nr:hypothetical protein [Clostridiaceae bacterium]